MKKKVSKKELREFGILIALAFPIIFGLFLPYLHGGSFRKWTFFISITSLFFSLFYPNRLMIFYIFWMKLGDILGFINGKLILGITHIIILQPLSFILKIFKYEPLEDIDKTLKTYKKKRFENKINYRKIF